MPTPIINISVGRLGPLRRPFTVDLSPLLVVSGDSNTGKSYLAMLIHFVYRVICSDELLAFLSDRQYRFTSNFGSSPSEPILTIRASALTEWINRRALQYLRDSLSYPELTGDIEISMPGLPETFDFYCDSTEIKTNNNTVMAIDVLRVNDFPLLLHIPQQAKNGIGVYPFFMLLRDFLRAVYDINPSRTFLLPPSRGSLLSLPDSLKFSLNDSMGMYQEFLNDLSTLKALKHQSDASNAVSDFIKGEVLNGDIKVTDNDISYLTHGTEIPITAAASSIKEIMPFALMVQKGLLSSYAILFEEPESHLHPELQLKVATLMAMALNEGAHLQITTHSDYMVRRLSNMIQLHRLRATLSADQYTEVCRLTGFDPDQTIDPAIVGAYYLYDGNDGMTYVKRQDVAVGIPFDSFQRVINEDLSKSSLLYEFTEYGFDSSKLNVCE